MENQNSLAVRYAFHEIFQKGNLHAYNQFVSESIQVHCPPSWKIFHPVEINSRGSAKVIDQMYNHAFKFHKVEIGRMFEHNDHVSVQWMCEGVNRNNFFHIDASDRPFSLNGQTTYRFGSESKVVEVWQSWDMLGLLQQISDVDIKKIVANAFELKKMTKKALLLSEREKDCLRLLIQGKTAVDTANELILSPRTIESYFENIKNKMGCLKKKEVFQIAQILNHYKLL